MLIEKAIEIYENSYLKELDLKSDAELEKESIKKIQGFLDKFDLGLHADSNPYKLEGLSFRVEPYQLVDEIIYYYFVSRICRRCKDEVSIDVMEQQNYMKLEKFGQWLAKPHLCDIENLYNSSEVGFTANNN